jgi:hypothetical protein
MGQGGAAARTWVLTSAHRADEQRLHGCITTSGLRVLCRASRFPVAEQTHDGTSEWPHGYCVRCPFVRRRPPSVYPSGPRGRPPESSAAGGPYRDSNSGTTETQSDPWFVSDARAACQEGAPVRTRGTRRRSSHELGLRCPPGAEYGSIQSRISAKSGATPRSRDEIGRFRT